MSTRNSPVNKIVVNIINVTGTDHVQDQPVKRGIIEIRRAEIVPEVEKEVIDVAIVDLDLATTVTTGIEDADGRDRIQERGLHAEIDLFRLDIEKVMPRSLQ